MPWGNTVTGVLLEDLTGQSETLPGFIKRKLDQLQSVEQIDPLVRFPLRVHFLCLMQGLTYKHSIPPLD